MERKTVKLDSFIFYSSFYEAIKELQADEQVAIYDAIFKYAFDGEEVELSGLKKAIFGLILPILKRNRSKYINGSKGGRPSNRNKTEIKPKQNLTETETVKSDNLTETYNKDKDKDKDKDNILLPRVCTHDEQTATKKERTKFIPPTLEEVKEYAKSRNRSDLAQKFYDYFTEGNWKDSEGKQVRAWKQKFITWETHNTVRQSEQVTGFTRNASERFTVDDLENFDDIEV